MPPQMIPPAIKYLTLGPLPRNARSSHGMKHTSTATINITAAKQSWEYEDSWTNRFE